MLNRRGFLAGLSAALAAPALVRAASLDYVPRKLILPEVLKAGDFVIAWVGGPGYPSMPGGWRPLQPYLQDQIAVWQRVV